MVYLLYVLGYVGIGQLMATLFTKLAPGDRPQGPTLAGMVLWWTLWPLATVLITAELVGGKIGTKLTAPPEPAAVAPQADLAEIARLERELGMGPPGDPEPLRPREFVSLPGVAAKACRLPKLRGAEYGGRYGYGTRDSPQNRRELDAQIDALTQLTDEFAAFGQTHAGQELLDAGEATLRQIGRIEEAIEPLFHGLTSTSYGRARKACVAARGRVGTVLDERLSAEL